MEEVKQYNTKNHHIFFYDDNLAADKKWLKQLLREFIKNKMLFAWSAQVRIDVYKDKELLELMKKSRCANLSIGFESVNPDTLEKINKKQSIEDIKKGIKIIRKNQISIHGMFVFGFDTDTIESLDETISFAKNTGINTVQFLILVPLPGTKNYKELKDGGRIFSNDWSLYDGHHVTFWPENINPFELQKMQIKGHREFYSFKRLIKKLIGRHFGEAAICFYAKNIDRLWQKKE